MRGRGQRVWIQRIVRAWDQRRGLAARRERGDTPAASAADALVSPSAEGLVVVFEDEWASVSPARERFAMKGGVAAQRRQKVDRESCARLGRETWLGGAAGARGHTCSVRGGRLGVTLGRRLGGRVRRRVGLGVPRAREVCDERRRGCAAKAEGGSGELCAPWERDVAWRRGGSAGTHLQRPRRTPWCHPRQKAWWSCSKTSGPRCPPRARGLR